MQRQQQKEQTTYEHFNQKEQKALEAFFDSKVDLITAGLQPRFNKYLKDERASGRVRVRLKVSNRNAKRREHANDLVIFGSPSNCNI